MTQYEALKIHVKSSFMLVLLEAHYPNQTQDVMISLFCRAKLQQS